VPKRARATAIAAAHGETWRLERVTAPIATIVLATDTSDRLVATAFGEAASIVAHARRFGAVLVEHNGTPTRAAAEIAEYLSGARMHFDVELRFLGTPFQRAAWTALTSIPFGELRSYAEQARAIGRPTALRAVGAANGRNPIPLVAPCHRVVASDGTLGGFTGGLAIKRSLLGHEAKIVGEAHDAGQRDRNSHLTGPLFAT
jgi:methylated-DNA-[protein]-cysteine S-methyltransferase